MTESCPNKGDIMTLNKSINFKSSCIQIIYTKRVLDWMLFLCQKQQVTLFDHLFAPFASVIWVCEKAVCCVIDHIIQVSYVSDQLGYCNINWVFIVEIQSFFKGSYKLLTSREIENILIIWYICYYRYHDSIHTNLQ